MNENTAPSVADIAAVVDNNRGYPYPMYNNGGFGNGFGGDWSWIIILLILCGGYGGFGGFGGFGGGFGNMFEFPWLLTGQQGINANTNQGFDTLQLSNQLGNINSGVQGLSTQLCNCCADINSNLCNGFAGVNATVNSGFANAETAANARQMANMQQAYTNQIATLQGFNGVTSQVATASADNRLGIANLNSTILAENCADRAALQEGVRDIIANQTANVQRILDQLCQDKIDAKNEKITDLQRELLMADLKASQIEQTATLRQGQEAEVDALYNRLSNCPVPTTPVYGRTPIFTCNNNGCGCNNGYNTLI